MEIIPIFGDILQSLFLFGIFFCGGSVLVSLGDRPSSTITLDGRYYHLACLLEDAPATSLKGQAYPLATPLMTPFACLWEDAPATSLKGQAYQLATPFACLWEDAPATSLKGQAYQLASLWEDAPATSLKGQFCQLATHFTSQTQTVSNSTPPGKKAETRTSGKTAAKDNPPVILVNQSQPWWKVLGVKPSATSLQVEKAYKNLIRTWHPDLNQDENATKITSILNVAYEEYKDLKHQQRLQQQNRRQNGNLFQDLLTLIKPLFSQ